MTEWSLAEGSTKKIISLFQRNYDTDHLVRNDVVPGAEWVLAGEGIPTRKFNGTACRVRDRQLYKRYDLKRGEPTPDGFEPAQEPDAVTGHQPGWVRVGEGPEDRWHREAERASGPIADGTYELCGPKVQGNAEGFPTHVLVRHGSDILNDVPREYEGIKEWLRVHQVEGIVWHHPDGRMVKIKRTDFFKDTRERPRDEGSHKYR